MQALIANKSAIYKYILHAVYVLKINLTCNKNGTNTLLSLYSSYLNAIRFAIDNKVIH